MSLKTALLAGAAAVALLTFSTPAYADANDETRELNLRQLENPGEGYAAVPGHEDDADEDDDEGDDAAADDGDDDDGGAGALGDDDADDGDDDDDDDGPE